MTQKKRKPVGICRKCGEHTGFLEHIGKRCYRRIDERKCGGIIRSVGDGENWRECASCSATGWIEGGKCSACEGHGWLYADSGDAA